MQGTAREGSGWKRTARMGQDGTGEAGTEPMGKERSGLARGDWSGGHGKVRNDAD